MHTFLEYCKVVHAMDPAVLTGDTTMAAIDRKGYDGVAILFHVGATGDTLSGSIYIECEVQDGVTDTTAACADADLSTSVTGTNTGTAAKIDANAEDSLTVKVEYTGTKRYIKPKFNLTGTHTNGTPCACTVILFNPTVKPVTQ